MAYKYKNFEEFVQALKTDNVLQAELKADPLATIGKVNLESEVPDTPVYRMLIIALMVTVLLIVSGVLAMALTGMAEKNQNVLTIFTAIASTAIGALAGVLMPVQKKG